MKDGENIRFSGEGDQEPGIEPGDVVIVLDEKAHEVFVRNGTDLTMKMEIELVEALCGFRRTIETLDKRTLVISSHPGKLITGKLVETRKELLTFEHQQCAILLLLRVIQM